MAKVKKAFFCRNCGYESAKWVGKCPSCGEWNTFVEETVQKEPAQPSFTPAGERNRPQPVREIQRQEYTRTDLGNGEMNRVLGGGLVQGSMILLGGEPGIGKSTLSLQLALKAGGIKTLYVSGEESPHQIKMRAERIGIGNDECYIYSETNLENILRQVTDYKPDLVIIDSIQTIHSDSIDSSPGSVSQIRECAALLMKYAKQTNTSVIIIGHITKDGIIAGPKILEHIVDVVLQFEGDNNNIYRILRSIKNRFGATFEIGVFEMRGEAGVSAICKRGNGGAGRQSVLRKYPGRRFRGGAFPMKIKYLGTAAYEGIPSLSSVRPPTEHRSAQPPVSTRDGSTCCWPCSKNGSA